MTDVESYDERRHVIAPHYLSVACFHEKHGSCRPTCDYCQQGCLCICHEQARKELRKL